MTGEPLPTIQAARDARGQGPQAPGLSHFRVLAEGDARALLQRFRIDGLSATSREIGEHLDWEGLAASIYRHALIEAGLRKPEGSEQPYDPCPRCGHQFS